MPDLLSRLHLKTFIAFDFETTGLNPNVDKVIEFAAVRFVNGKPEKTLSFLCNPGVEISPLIEALTGISDKMVQDRMPFENRLNEVLEFIGNSPLVGHNVGFDLGFLKTYLKRHPDFKKYRINNSLYDTSSLSRAFFFYLHNHSLATVSEYCQLSSEGAHRAEADALNCGQIFLKLLPEVVKYDLDTLQTINMVLKDTNDPNKWLYQNAAKFLLLSKSIGDSKIPVIDWTPPVNILGSKIEPSKQSSETKLSASVEDYFCSEGFLSRELENYEPRNQQSEMAQHVLSALNNGHVAVIEAGTGVGKSLAYLLPSVLWLKNNSRNHFRLVIASNTKTLQEQVFFKEIPFVNDRLNLNFKAVMLKGRTNYICLTRWNRYLADIGNRVHYADRSSLIPIIIWLKHTKTGDISENNGFKLKVQYQVWSEICSEPGYCTTGVCQKYNGCYLGKARFHASTADVIVVNHSLLLSDAAAENTVLPEYDALVIDEAHNLEKNSYNYFSSKINLPILNALLKTIYSSGQIERGALIDTLQLMSQYKKVSKIENDVIKIKDHIGDLKIAAENFYKAILTHSSRHLKTNNGYSLKRRYKNFPEEFPDIQTEPKSFLYELSIALSVLQDLVIKVDNLVKELPEGFDELRIRFTNVISAMQEYEATLKRISVGDNDDLIFWYEVSARANEYEIEFASTPLDMSSQIFEKLLKDKNATILTSATLQVADTFEYVLNRTGVSNFKPEKLDVISVGSPFEYMKQMKFFTYHRANFDQDELTSLSSLLIKLVNTYNKGILVLFTSYAALSKVSRSIQPTFKKLGVTLLTQGFGGSRTSLLEHFRKDKASVLLGTDSFWEGIDVIGDSLEILIIPKLPFPVPSEPIIEANVEKLKLDGRNPFNEYYVPESILKFRQGIGRLIRSKSDRGIVINMDDRIDKKSYGRLFKNSIPVNPKSINGMDDLIAEIGEFFK